MIIHLEDGSKKQVKITDRSDELFNIKAKSIELDENDLFELVTKESRECRLSVLYWFGRVNGKHKG